MKVSFNAQEGQVILNLLNIACGSPDIKPGGLEVAMQATAISTKILNVFNNKDNQNVEDTDGDGSD